eukprot:Rhum_TRINITY_DN14404_c5_g1::Rhum_TRINITY_DN14404_c5_g1_i1::g.87921::m.87921/K05863/SLC25A4S, ANT; solute carrier family 25 (mitochondrial adenine nucleotide translocator), member 4/5/6/31
MATTAPAAAQGSVTDYAAKLGHFGMVQAAPVGVKMALYPVERIRLLMQTQHLNSAYKGVALSSAAKTVGQMKIEGGFSAWKGMTPTLVRWFPSQYIHLFMKDVLSNAAPAYSKQDQYAKYFATKVGSGAATGVGTALVWAYPLDVMRQQLATKNAGTWRNAASQVVKEHGFRGFYRGFLMDAPGLMIFRGVQLGGWDLIKDFYGKSWSEKGTLDRFAHGMLISMMGSVFSYPCDTIRRNLISASKASSYGEVFRTGVATAGGLRRFFFAGFSARIMSSIVNGALLEGFDHWKRTRE